AKWTKAVHGLSNQKLASIAVQLPVSSTDVMGDSVSKYIFHRLSFLCRHDINSFHKKIFEKRFVDTLIWSNDCTIELAENNWLFWNRQVLLLTMVTVVHSNAYNFSRICDRCQKFYLISLQDIFTTLNS
ncbi:hypothetical protein EGW08_019469, partial [Elysia chlorotica]